MYEVVYCKHCKGVLKPNDIAVRIRNKENSTVAYAHKDCREIVKDLRQWNKKQNLLIESYFGYE